MQKWIIRNQSGRHQLITLHTTSEPTCTITASTLVTTSMSHASPVAVGESAPVVFTILPTIPMGEYIATGSTLHVVQCRVCGTHAPTVREAWCVPIATQHIYQPARKTQNCSTV